MASGKQNSSGGGALSIVYSTVLEDVNNLGSYSFTVTTTAGERRAVVFQSEGLSAGLSYNITGATWDGDPVTPLVTAGGGNSSLVAIYMLDAKPTGSYTFTVNLTADQARACLGIYNVLNYTGAADPQSALATSGTSSSVTTNVGANQAVLAASTTGNSVSYTWSNATKNYELASEGGLTGFTAALRDPGTANSALVVSVSHGNSSQPISLASIVII